MQTLRIRSMSMKAVTLSSIRSMLRFMIAGVTSAQEEQHRIGDVAGRWPRLLDDPTEVGCPAVIGRTTSLRT